MIHNILAVRFVALADGETIHNAFFDRTFCKKQPQKTAAR